jgi:hypothetical protein
MQSSVIIICSLAFILSACSPPLEEKKLIGEWIACSNDVCTIMALNGDRTFSDRFNEKDLPGDICSGTWRVDGHHLVLHLTHADKVLRDVVGKDVHFLISRFQHDRFVATSTEDSQKPVTWERRH